MNAGYSYTIGTPKMEIPKPSIQVNTCATTCVVRDTEPHAWWTDSSSHFELETDDVSIVGALGTLDLNDVIIFTDSPTPC